MLHWLAVFLISFCDSFAQLEELRAIGRVWKAKGRRAQWAIWWGSRWTNKRGESHWEIGVVPWSLALVVMQNVNGILVYRVDPWLAVPESLGNVLGCACSLTWRKWKKARKPSSEPSPAALPPDSAPASAP